MASYTTSLRLVQPATGEYTGTWGTQVNTGLTALVDTSVAGTANITMTAADYTLSTANGASDEARAMVLNLTGSPGTNRSVICPAVSKVYIVYNNTTGGFAQTLKTASGTGISIPNGRTAFLRCDGTNVVEAVNYAASLTLGAALPVASGGTGSTSTTYCSLTSNVTGTLPVANGGTGATTQQAAINALAGATTSGQFLRGNGTNVAMSAIQVSDVPTLNQNTTGTASNVTGTVAVANGGTGATTLTGVVKGNGTAAFTAGNVNLASEVTGTLPVANGGTGVTTSTGSGNNVLSTSPVLTTPNLGTPSAGVLTNATGLPLTTGVTGTLPVGNGGTGLTNFTANGIVYASSTSALATGSALTFDGTNLATTGTATATKFIPTGGTATGNGMYLPAANTLAWSTAGAEGMRLDSSGNLGIGTSSPSYKLDVSGTARISNGGDSYFGFGANRDNYFTTGTTSGIQVWRNSAGAEYMRLDSSGNLGIGGTPSASWSSSWSALQIGVSAAMWAFKSANGLSGSYFSNNSAFNGTNRVYINTAAATEYAQVTGQHIWYNAPSGTAGTTISITQAMTLDTSGNLLVGKTGVEYTAKLSVKGTGASAVPTNLSDLSGALMLVESGKANTAFGGVGYIDSGGGGAAVVFGRGGTYDTQILFCTNPSSTTTAGAMTERARIDSSGNLLVGTTTNSEGYKAKLVGTQVASTLGVWNNQASGNFDGENIYFGGSAPNNGTSRFLYCNDTAGTRFTALSNGGLANYQANDVNLSDRREKTNFAPAKNYLDTICAIPVQTFNYVDQNFEEDPGKTLGVVAQDVQAVAPELVMESNWGDKDAPKMRLSIYQTDLQYALMKCIQELKAQNDDLRARVAQLEAKA